jgi:hypothetical protein
MVCETDGLTDSSQAPEERPDDSEPVLGGDRAPIRITSHHMAFDVAVDHRPESGVPSRQAPFWQI